MKILLFLLLLSSAGYQALAQVSDDSLAAWFRDAKYEEIIQEVGSRPADSASYWAAYSCGLSYFVREQDSLALVWLERAILKSPFQAGPYYYAGLILQSAGDLTTATSRLKTAVQMDQANPDYWLALSEVTLQQGQVDSAFQFLSRAKGLQQPPAKVYMLLADIFLAEKAEKAALDEYYDCMYKADVQSDGYTSCLYNIGYLELKANRPQDAEAALSYLLTFDRNDYAAMELLVQALVRMERLGDLNYYVEQLYAAFRQSALPASMDSAFTLDIFLWKGQQVIVQERFATPASEHIKYDFFVVDDSMEVVRHVVAAYHPGISDGNTYFLAEIKGEEALIYLDSNTRVGRVDYFHLRGEVLGILKGERTMTATRPATLLGY